MRGAFLADRARISGRETVAIQHNSPNFHLRILVSSDVNGSFRPSRNSGEVGRNSKSFAKSSWVNVREIFPLGHFQRTKDSS